MVSQGFKLDKLDVRRGRVLDLAGENPDDVRMRWMATTQQFALTPEDVDNVYFVPGAFKFTKISERIHQEMEARELALVLVETSAPRGNPAARARRAAMQSLARRAG